MAEKQEKPLPLAEVKQSLLLLTRVSCTQAQDGSAKVVGGTLSNNMRGRNVAI